MVHLWSRFELKQADLSPKGRGHSVHEFPLNLPEKPSEALEYLSTIFAGLAALPISYCRPTSRMERPAFMGWRDRNG